MNVVSNEEVRDLLREAQESIEGERDEEEEVEDEVLVEVNALDLRGLCEEVLEYRRKLDAGEEIRVQAVPVRVKHSHTDENGVQTDIEVRAGTAEEAIEILNHLWE